MADNLTTTTQVDPGTATFYDKVLLEAAKPELVHELFALKRPLAQKSGNTIKFRRYSNLSVAKTPLTEGVTPPGQLLSKTDITATISWYGDYVHITDVVDQTVEDDEWVVAGEKLGFQSGETRDELVRDIIAACASSTNASAGSNGGTPTELTKSDIDGIVVTLLGYNAKMIAPKITAGTGVATRGVRPAFWGILNTALIDDLQEVDGYTNPVEYARQDGIMDQEWGATGNVRWLQSSKGYLSGSTYSLPIMGKDAMGVTDLEGSMKNIRKGYGSGGTEDPIDQRATSGWKMAFVARILNDEFMHILKVTHS
ncbi:MAG: N4-gp56 family major capsid protein [Pseudodesulfovibrio sp.]|nr:N4-gp56 family major capsid protein [Pseudodesulfovibrio sp.]